MKKVTLLVLVSLLFLISTNSLIAQEYNYIFLGNDFMPYKGALLRVNDKIALSVYKNLKDFKDRKVLYPQKGSNLYASDKEKLKNRTFIVNDIIDEQGKSYSSENISKYVKPIFILKDISNNEVIYYEYNNNERYHNYFPFDAANIILPEDYWCSKINRKVDEFTDEVQLSSPSIPIEEPQIFKFNNDCYLHLQLRHLVKTVGGNGVIILFTDGSKWSNENITIDVEKHKDKDRVGIKYSAIVQLSKDDLEIFSKKTIKKFRLGQYDRSLNLNIAEELQEYFKCMSKLK